MILPDITAQFQSAKPFPHVVIEDLFDRNSIAAAASQVPPREDPRWSRHSNKLSPRLPKKLGITDLAPFPAIKAIVDQMLSDEFTAWLSEASGIGGLIADKTLSGAGLHGTQPGGLLGIHVDFDRLGPLYRRLNAFVYLNADWQPGWGGDLELHGDTIGLIPPTLGTFVAFETSEQSWHGHTNPLQCPPDRLRASLAAYFYSKERPTWYKDDHSTVYRDLQR